MRSEAFAIYHTWPDLRNAEYEVLQRMLKAAERIGKYPVVIDNGGTVIWSHPSLNIHPGRTLAHDDVAFAISLHFESPRVCDIYTYYALWQPIEFYADFGYQVSIDKFSTHNDLLSCHSDIADNHAVNIFHGLGRNLQTPLPTLFHALPEPFLEPRINEGSSLFYIGINWERIGRPKGRFHEVLTRLDAQKMIRIYGPELIQGVAPWEGFQTYSGELPFDGSSMLEAINSCGVCLALSSKAHQNSGIMSNRLFEGLSSGAAVIANPNPIIDKYFKDIAYIVDDSRGEAFLEQQIVGCLRQIRNDPEAARQRVLRGQDVLRQLCSLEGSLQSLFDTTVARQQHYYNDFPRLTELAVILVASEVATTEAVRAKIADLSKQIRCKIQVHLVASAQTIAALPLESEGCISSITPHRFEFEPRPQQFDGRIDAPKPIGGIIRDIISALDVPFFAINYMNDILMRDHFATLARAIVKQGDAQCAVSGTLVRSFDHGGREQRRLAELRLENTENLLTAETAPQPGRLLFRTSLFKPEQTALMKLLDGEEHTLFVVGALLEGPLAQSNFASHMRDEAAPISIRDPALSRDLQAQFIRDYFSGDARWATRMWRRAGDLQLLPTADPSSARRWNTLHSPASGTKTIEPGRTVALHTGSPGLEFLVSGFSFPEEAAVWLANERGVIEFALPSRAARHIEDYKVVLSLLGRRSRESGRMQHCTFIINNLAVAYQAIPDFFTNISIKIPRNVMKDAASFRLEILPDHCEPVFDESGNVVDQRNLSVLLSSIAVVRDSNEVAAILPVNTMQPVSEGEAITRSLTSGFYAPERVGTWICGQLGEIHIRVRDAVTEPVLLLKLEGRPDNDLGTPQEARISINGRETSRLLLTREAKLYEVPLQSGDLGEVTHISIRARHAEPVVDSSGIIVDPRLLGIAVYEIGVFERRIYKNRHDKPRRNMKSNFLKFIKAH